MSRAGSAARAPGGADVLEAMSACPGGRELLALTRTRDDAALVGGATRDLLLERMPRELDVAVAGDAAALAGEVASLIGGASAVTVHDRFGTAVVEWPAGRMDIAERRAETYRAPGALPEVRRGTVEEDLRRRDFTVNAIAVTLGGPERGKLDAAQNALADLAARRLRVLHERSFIDDPTRLLRLARYEARLGFEPEPATAALAAVALAGGALATVSRPRVGAELRLALAESDPVTALAALDELGVLAAFEPQLRFDEQLANRALALLPEDGRAEVLALAVLLLSASTEPHAPAAISALLDGLEFTAAERQAVLRTVLRAPALVEELRDANHPSQVYAAAAAATVEAVALAGALAAVPGGERSAGRALESAREWLQCWRQVRLQITGDDLLAAGIPAGPEIGRRLEIALRRRLDGELADGREAELRAALEGAV